MSLPPVGLTQLILADRSAALAAAWREVFEDEDMVEVYHGDFFTHAADAMVSPANSFGIMDGGLDLAIRDTLGFSAEARLQEIIKERFYGEMPVGSAVVVRTDNPKWPWMVSAPTMRVPEPVSQTLNPYLAFRAALVAVLHHNQGSAQKIRSMVVPGLCTGIGRVSARRCAGQMRIAWRQLQGPARIGSYDLIHRVHDILKRVG
ncbi:MAG: macro domain-containing protein [Myxococcota bacterium]